MSDRWVPRANSRWSSERARARRRHHASETPSPDSSAPASGEDTPRDDASSAPVRRDDEQTGGTDASSSSGSEQRSHVVRSPRFQRNRESPRIDNGEGAPPSGGSLPDLPGSQGPGGPRGGRMLVLGALLFVAMAVIALLPRMLDDNGGSSPTPTPEMIQTPTPVSEGAQLADVVPAQSVPDAGQLVCIDAGHGGWDTGRTREANSRAPAMEEKDITIGMSWMLKNQLEKEGIGVVMTRPGGLAVNTFNQDVNGDGETLQDSRQAGDRDELQARINICNEADADILVSLHLNGVRNATARGYEVWYTPAPVRAFGEWSADLATYIYRGIGAAYDEVGFETMPRGAEPDTELDAEKYETGTADHLIMTGPAIDSAEYSITPSKMPGVVIEPVFITNDDDAAFIADPKNQQLLANAYAEGIMTYFEHHPDGPQDE